MTRSVRICAAIAAVIVSVFLAQMGARHYAVSLVAGEYEKRPPGIEITSVDGVSDYSARLIKIFSDQALRREKIAGSYTVDVIVKAAALDDGETAAVLVVWHLSVAGGQSLGVAHQEDAVPIAHLNDYPELIWSSSVRGAVRVLLEAVRTWEAKEDKNARS
jgi:hypothetical protein